MATGIEQELLDASGFEPGKKLGRQDYLAALARAIHEIDEIDFDGMSVEAQDWFNDAVRCLNKKKDLPEFPDAETETEVVEASGDPSEDDITEDDETDPEDGEDDGVDAEAEAPPPKAAKTKKAKKPEPEPEEVKPTKAAKKAKKVEPEPEPEPDEEVRPQKKGIGDMANRPKDKWGFPINTQTSAAMTLFEKGCRMADVTEAIGGSYYNALAKAVKRGHTLEKATNGMLKLTCMEATPKKSNKGKK